MKNPWRRRAMLVALAGATAATVVAPGTALAYDADSDPTTGPALADDPLANVLNPIGELLDPLFGTESPLGSSN